MQPPPSCEENRNAGHFFGQKAIFRNFTRFSAVFKALVNFFMGFPLELPVGRAQAQPSSGLGLWAAWPLVPLASPSPYSSRVERGKLYFILYK